MKTKKISEAYVSVDVEADGPIPGEYSMLSIGCAAFTIESGTAPISTFSANLELLDDARQHPDTMKFWMRNVKAWNETRSDTRHPKDAMRDLAVWLRSLPGKLVFVGYPATFDFMWYYWYLVKFAGESANSIPTSFSGLDLKSYACALMGSSYRDVDKRSLKKRWGNASLRHTHVALDDAVEQGTLFINMLRERSTMSMTVASQTFSGGRF